MGTLGRGLARAGRRNSPLAFSDRRGGQIAAAAQPGCLGVSRVPGAEWIGDVSKGEPRLGKERPRGEGSRQRWCQGIHASTLRLAPALSQEGHSSRRRGWGWFPDLCPEPLLLTDVHPHDILGNILLVPPVHR